jgi:hypothetical protein
VVELESYHGPARKTWERLGGRLVEKLRGGCASRSHAGRGGRIPDEMYVTGFGFVKLWTEVQLFFK